MNNSVDGNTFCVGFMIDEILTFYCMIKPIFMILLLFKLYCLFALAFYRQMKSDEM